MKKYKINNFTNKDKGTTVIHVENHTNDVQWVVEAKLLEHIKTPFQVMDVYENKTFGKFFTLDNWMQYTEKDEFIYQEMLVHPAFAINSNIKNVLVIGGGDGGIVREVCKYKGVKHIDWIDIDGKVVEVCGKYFPSTAYTDKRVNFMAIDGIDWVKKSNSSKYDLVIVDSSDPDDTDSGAVLAASTLFTKEFYLNCKRILTKNGILTCQGESPYYEGDRRNLLRSYNMLKNTFPKNYLCEFFLPTYASGYFTSGYATKTFSPFKINAKKWNSLKIKTKYYNTDIHEGSFRNDNFVRTIIKTK